jgi:3-dehydroquinate dehydratase-2
VSDLRAIVVHGPNLNLLGEREPEVYGRTTLAEIDASLVARAAARGAAVKCFQANGEGALIDFIHAERRWARGIVINPGAYTHYSYALRDALAAVALPCVEVHLSDITKREEWRRISVIAPVCFAQVMGKGPAGYVAALDLLLDRLGASPGPSSG